MPGLMDGIGQDWRPRYGAANQGYDMEAARQYPQIDPNTAAELGWLAAGGGVAGLAGRGVARGLARGGEVASSIMFPTLSTLANMGGYNAAANINAAGRIGGTIGGAFGLGITDAANTYTRNAPQTAERQYGGFYGPIPPQWRDAEGQPGGFYGRR